MNISKTKELVIGRKVCPDFTPVTINNEYVEVVSCFKYLGSILDDKLTFHEILTISQTSLNNDCIFLGN